MKRIMITTMTFLLIAIVVAFGGSNATGQGLDAQSTTKFNKIFSAQSIALVPGGRLEFGVPATAKGIVVTDLYIENLGGGVAELLVQESPAPGTYFNRYTFKTNANEKVFYSFTTGLRLPYGVGDVITGFSFQNDGSSVANLRVLITGHYAPY